MKKLILLVTVIFCLEKNQSFAQTNGTQTISYQIFDKRSGNLISHPFMPDDKLWYYGNYVLEFVSNVKAFSAHNKDSVALNTNWYLINLSTKKFTAYNQLSPNGRKTKILDLINKGEGTDFLRVSNKADYIYGNQSLRDTVINRQKYKYLKARRKNKGTPSQEIECTLYFDMKKAASGIPFHISELAEKEYQGTVIRLDNRNLVTGEAVSVSVRNFPEGLTEKELTLLKSLIKTSGL